MRIVCGPVTANRIAGPSTPLPKPLSCHPQPLRPHPVQSSSTIVVADVDPMRYTACPALSTLPENCTNTESLLHEFASARPRSQSRYGVPACASNVNSTKFTGAAIGPDNFEAPASGCVARKPPAAVLSDTSRHAPDSLDASPAYRTMSPDPSPPFCAVTSSSGTLDVCSRE